MPSRPHRRSLYPCRARSSTSDVILTRWRQGCAKRVVFINLAAKLYRSSVVAETHLHLRHGGTVFGGAAADDEAAAQYDGIRCRRMHPGCWVRGVCAAAGRWPTPCCCAGAARADRSATRGGSCSRPHAAKSNALTVTHATRFTRNTIILVSQSARQHQTHAEAHIPPGKTATQRATPTGHDIRSVKAASQCRGYHGSGSTAGASGIQPSLSVASIGTSST